MKGANISALFLFDLRTLLFASFFSGSRERLLLQLPHQLHLSSLPGDFWKRRERFVKRSAIKLWVVSGCGLVWALPWASSLRSSLASDGLGNSVWPTLGGRPFLRREPEPELLPAPCWRSVLGGRPLRPSMALIRGITSSSLSGHHCRPWGWAWYEETDQSDRGTGILVVFFYILALSCAS